MIVAVRRVRDHGFTLQGRSVPAVRPLHSGPGQIQQLTPWCELHVPLRFCEQLKVPSLHRAVAVPQVAANGLATVQIFDPGAGVGGAADSGLATDWGRARVPEPPWRGRAQSPPA